MICSRVVWTTRRQGHATIYISVNMRGGTPIRMKIATAKHTKSAKVRQGFSSRNFADLACFAVVDFHSSKYD